MNAQEGSGGRDGPRRRRASGRDSGKRKPSAGTGSAARRAGSWDQRKRTTGAGRRDGRQGKSQAAPRRAPKHEPVHLGDDVVRELKAAARPGKGELLVKVFSDAVAAYAGGDLDEAIELGDQAKHMALRSTNAREFLGLAYYEAGRWQEAARELSTFRRIAGTNDQNPVIADCYRAMGKPQKALDLCDQIDRRTSEEAVVFEGEIVAAGALADMGRPDDAITRLQALPLEPDVAQEHHLRAWYVLADLLEKQGRFTQARKWFDSVASADAEMTDAPERATRLAAKDS